MDFFKAIKSRYTHKEKFLKNPIPREHLEMIANAGLFAPTGRNSQSVQLIIIDDAEILAQLCSIASSEGLRTAPAAIAVMTDPATQTVGVNYEKEDYSAAVENMLLATTALGYASAWLDGIIIEREKQLGYLRVLGAPEEFNLHAILPVGVPDGSGTRRVKKPFTELLSYNIYGRKE